ADVAATEQADAEILLGRRDAAQGGPECGAPAGPEPLPIVRPDTQTAAHLIDRLRVGRTFVRKERLEAGLGLQPLVQLVPLDLVRDQRRDDVVDVGLAGHVYRQGLRAVVVPLPAAAGRLHRLPVLDAGAERAGEMLGELTEHHALDGAGDGGQAVDGVDEGARVERAGIRPRVEARVHIAMRRLEGAQPNLTRAAQHRTVGADVQLDLLAP